jgi:hypothetical protein
MKSGRALIQSKGGLINLLKIIEKGHKIELGDFK